MVHAYEAAVVILILAVILVAVPWFLLVMAGEVIRGAWLWYLGALVYVMAVWPPVFYWIHGNR